MHASSPGTPSRSFVSLPPLPRSAYVHFLCLRHRRPAHAFQHLIRMKPQRAALPPSLSAQREDLAIPPARCVRSVSLPLAGLSQPPAERRLYHSHFGDHHKCGKHSHPRLWSHDFLIWSRYRDAELTRPHGRNTHNLWRNRPFSICTSLRILFCILESGSLSDVCFSTRV